MTLRLAGVAAAGGTVCVAALMIGTEVAAWRFGWHSSLGSPLAAWDGVPIYAPWSILRWLSWWPNAQPVRLGLLAAGLTLTACLALSIKRAVAHAQAFGAKEWATARDAAQAGLLSDPKNGGIVVGRLGRRLLTFAGDQHVLVLGASGAGKSSGPIMSTLLSCRDRSMLVLDPKGELYRMSALFRSTIGPALYFDPTKPESARFNPLDDIPVGTFREIPAVQNIASLLIDASGLKNSEPIWPITAADLLSAVILWAVNDAPADERHLGALWQRMWDMPNTLAAMSGSRHSVARLVANTMIGMSTKTADSIALTARSALSPWVDPLLTTLTSRSDFRISDLACGRRPVSLYLQVPTSDRDRVMPLFRLMLMQVFKAFLWSEPAMPDGRKKVHRLQFIGDEFPAAGQIPGFDSDIQMLRSHGVSCMLLCQSVKSLKGVYGDKQVIRANCHIETHFASSDPDDAAELSKACNDAIEVKTTVTTQRWKWLQGSTSKSEARRSLLTPADVRALGMDEAIVLVTGCKPLRARKVRWFQLSQFRTRSIDLHKHPDTPTTQNARVLAAQQPIATAQPKRRKRILQPSVSPVEIPGK